MSRDRNDAPGSPDTFDTTTDARFYQYYQEQSLSEAATARFARLADLTLKVMRQRGRAGPFDVVDVGGGAGTLGRMYAREGHRVTCVDISSDLLALGRQRAQAEGLDLDFVNCSATAVPLADDSVDICLVPELLEHVEQWRAVLDEAARILRPGGLLYLSTTNVLCPRQDEFELPLYSWYPAALKRYCVRLARTTQPWLANYGKYPALHWFSYAGLCDALAQRGFGEFMDRLDMIQVRTEGTGKARVAGAIAAVAPGRFAVQLLTPNSLLLAFRSADT
ncbi:MAG: class I SAM-dependent methyltransferase [Halioglobus sp.]|nr:class I SAM-dependent methyltransferase [Halioglobus sp.]